MIVLCLIFSLATFETKANLIPQVGHNSLLPPWPTLPPRWPKARPQCYTEGRGEPCGPICCKPDEACKRINYVKLWNYILFFKSWILQNIWYCSKCWKPECSPGREPCGRICCKHYEVCNKKFVRLSKIFQMINPKEHLILQYLWKVWRDTWMQRNILQAMY